MNEHVIGNLVVMLVLVAGAASIARGLWMLRAAPRGTLAGEAGERGRQRCMAWVVAGCMFLSIPALVGYVSTPADPEAASATSSVY